MQMKKNQFQNRNNIQQEQLSRDLKRISCAKWIKNKNCKESKKKLDQD